MILSRNRFVIVAHITSIVAVLDTSSSWRPAWIQSNMVFLAVVLLLSGCKPDACISLPTELLAIGKPVTFGNCSLKADSYSWSIDGITYTTVEATHEFRNPGTYPVGLTAIKGKRENSTLRDVYVGWWQFTEFRALQLPMLNPMGDAWDPDMSGPDLQLRLTFSDPELGQAGTSWISSIIDDVDVSQPYTFELLNFQFPDRHAYQFATFELYDIDGATSELMLTVTFDHHGLPDGAAYTETTADYQIEIPRTFR